MNYKMQNVKFIKSFSRGQITIPKDIRLALGVPEEFWMKLFVDDGKLIVESVQKHPAKNDYLHTLLSLDTSWFSQKDADDYKKVRTEIEEHVEKNSL